MTQKPKTKRPGSARRKTGTKAKKAKKATVARRAREYEHHYGLDLRKS